MNEQDRKEVENIVKSFIYETLTGIAFKIGNCCKPPNDDDFVILRNFPSHPGVNLFGLFDRLCRKLATVIRSFDFDNK